MEKGQAEFQMLDNYIKEYKIQVNEKIPEDSKVDFNGEMGFRIINITEEEQRKVGEIELSNKIEILLADEKKGEIHIVMGGLFASSNKLQTKKFQEMLQVNGTATLSQFVRTYIHANTSLSGMPGIRIPMINFVSLFQDIQEK